MMKNIQTIIFDLGGVIINLKSEKEWLEDYLLLNFHAEKLQQLQRNNFFHNFETGKIAVPDFILQLKNSAIDQNISDEQIIRNWNGILKDIPKHRIEFLQQLKLKYRLILLSNTNHLHMNAIREYMIQKFGEDVLESTFHRCYYSQEIGLRKPHKEIFHYVLKSENIMASDCLFLDDKNENLLEPDKMGIRTKLMSGDISEMVALLI